MTTLIAIDGSPTSQAAIDQIVALPEPGGQIDLLHVLEATPPHSSGMLAWPELHAEIQAAHERARAMLDHETERLRDAGFETTALVRDGDVASVILELAETRGVEQVVVGSHGRGTIGRFVLGSVSNRVLHHAPCSVMVARPRASTRATGPRVLIGFDNSEPARAAVDFLANASWRSSAQVTVLAVQQLTNLFRMDLLEADCQQFQEENTALEIALDQIADRLAPDVASIDTLTHASPRPHEILLRVAAERDTDLILLGHAGRSAVGRFLLGSVATKVAHQAGCSVLVVRR